MGLGSDRLLIAPEFFKRGARKVTFNVPAGFADPHVIPAHNAQDADPTVIDAIAAVRPIRLAAVLVPIVDAEG